MIKKKEFGVQPLDEWMTRFALSNHDLVGASTEQLTHKMVSKGRKGRRLTLNARHKILAALKVLKPDQPVTLKELFNY